MRRYSAILILVVAIALLFGVAACGGSGSSDNGAPAQSSGKQTPQGIVSAAFLASQNMKSASGSFDVSVSFDADASKAPEEMKAFIGSPIKVTGTFSTAQEPEAADITMSMQMAGQTLDMALKSVDGKSYLQLGGQWYEVSADMLGAGLTTDSTAGATTTTSQPTPDEVMKLLTDLGIDPTTWMKDLTLVGEEKVDGAGTYHIKGTPDVAKMMTDVLQLMKSPEFTKLMGSAGTDAGSAGMGLESLIPSPDELQKTQNQITEMFQGFTVEAWVDKAESFVRKAVIAAHITAPAGQDSQGLNAIDLNVTVTMKDFNKAVKVEVPASVLPMTDLEKAIQDNPNLLGPLSGLLGGLMSGMGSLETGGVDTSAGTDTSIPSDISIPAGTDTTATQ